MTDNNRLADDDGLDAEWFMRRAADGGYDQAYLASLLEPGRRREYLDACAAIERSYTTACRATNDPCLESGCSMDEASGDICLQPLLAAGEEFDRACAAEWMKLFKDPENRIATWRGQRPNRR